MSLEDRRQADAARKAPRRATYGALGAVAIGLIAVGVVATSACGPWSSCAEKCIGARECTDACEGRSTSYGGNSAPTPVCEAIVPVSTPDASSVDAALPDASSVDAAADASFVDAALPDASSVDAALADASSVDAASPEASTLAVTDETCLAPCMTSDGVQRCAPHGPSDAKAEALFGVATRVPLTVNAAEVLGVWERIPEKAESPRMRIAISDTVFAVAVACNGLHLGTRVPSRLDPHSINPARSSLVGDAKPGACSIDLRGGEGFFRYRYALANGTLTVIGDSFQGGGVLAGRTAFRKIRD